MNEVRICFVGESFVNGTGDPDCLGWAGRICVNANRKGYEITYYNLGVRRETSSELKNRWLTEVSYRLPKEYDVPEPFQTQTIVNLQTIKQQNPCYCLNNFQVKQENRLLCQSSILI